MKKKEVWVNMSNQFIEAVDENGKSIPNIRGIQIYKDSLIIYTDTKLYSNNPEVLFDHPKKTVCQRQKKSTINIFSPKST